MQKSKASENEYAKQTFVKLQEKIKESLKSMQKCWMKGYIQIY